MNVLMLLSQLEVTGAEVYAVSVSDNLIAKGHKVFIVSDTLTIATKARYFSMQLNKRRMDLQIKHTIKLIRIIKQHKITILHAHSRIACKLGYIAARLCRIPMIYTAHGHQHVHLSKKIYKAYGDYVLAICENVKDQAVRDLHWNAKEIEILRNGIDSSVFSPTFAKQPEKPVVSIIGRLSGTKGDVAYRVLEEICLKNHIGTEIEVKVIGGSTIPDRFSVFKRAASFLGIVTNVRDQIANSSVVIGSGRVAMESLMTGKPTIAFGEAAYEGLINSNNLERALKSNFGDIAYPESMDVSYLAGDVLRGIKMQAIPDNIRKNITEQFDLSKVANRIEDIYQNLYSRKKYEVPVLLYHRIITDSVQAGVHGTYITLSQIEAHFKYLKRKGYTTLTFEELSMIDRFDVDKKYVVLTFDDGYRDNYTLLLPLLEKYEFKAVIYLVTNKTENDWDLKDEKRTFPLLTREQVTEMSRRGIEFGAHTMNHADLTEVSTEEAWKEITGSKSYIENLLGKKVKTFAYPYGKVNDAVKAMVKKAGFTYGIGTVNGPLAMHQDLFNIRRIVIHPDTGILRFKRKVKGNYIYRKNKGFVYKGGVGEEV